MKEPIPDQGPDRSPYRPSEEFKDSTQYLITRLFLLSPPPRDDDVRLSETIQYRVWSKGVANYIAVRQDEEPLVAFDQLPKSFNLMRFLPPTQQDPYYKVRNYVFNPATTEMQVVNNEYTPEQVAELGPGSLMLDQYRESIYEGMRDGWFPASRLEYTDFLADLDSSDLSRIN